MIKSREFTAFGRKYRTSQLSAVYGLELLDNNNAHPLSILSKTEAYNEADDKWYPLANESNINIFVFDMCMIIAPRLVLQGVIKLVHEFNFQFLETWKGIKVPHRFRENSDTVSSKYVHSIISSLIREDIASLEKLETYYSLQDAFFMYDVMTEKAVNSCLASEAARKRK